jgi:hypothetical protein
MVPQTYRIGCGVPEVRFKRLSSFARYLSLGSHPEEDWDISVSLPRLHEKVLQPFVETRSGWNSK